MAPFSRVATIPDEPVPSEEHQEKALVGQSPPVAETAKSLDHHILEVESADEASIATQSPSIAGAPEPVVEEEQDKEVLQLDGSTEDILAHNPPVLLHEGESLS